ncbi:MAG: hypothetical protein ABJF10_09330 [Chthoniobacter sp.]|uniref:hypothetical protein n=1 Tax=Chthoniobacter sp. TaxID=2510640 RepID=UPI0032A84A47
MAWKETWDSAIGQHWKAVACAAASGCVAAWITKFMQGADAMNQAIASGVGAILAALIVFLAVYLLHLIYITPKGICQRKQIQVRELRSALSSIYSRADAPRMVSEMALFESFGNGKHKYHFGFRNHGERPSENVILKVIIHKKTDFSESPITCIYQHDPIIYKQTGIMLSEEIDFAKTTKIAFISCRIYFTDKLAGLEYFESMDWMWREGESKLVFAPPAALQLLREKNEPIFNAPAIGLMVEPIEGNENWFLAGKMQIAQPFVSGGLDDPSQNIVSKLREDRTRIMEVVTNLNNILASSWKSEDLEGIYKCIQVGVEYIKKYEADAPPMPARLLPELVIPTSITDPNVIEAWNAARMLCFRLSCLVDTLETKAALIIREPVMPP